MTDRARTPRQYRGQWCRISVKKVSDNLLKRASKMIISPYVFDRMYTRWPILIYNPKYLLKYFMYEKMVRTKVDQERGGHLTVPSILTLRSFFKVNSRIFDCGFEKSGKFHVKNGLWKNGFCEKIKVKCLRNDQIPFFWIVLVFRGEQTFKMLHKSHHHDLLVNFQGDMKIKTIFQQNVVPPHFALIVREFLNSNFDERWIGRVGPFKWPPCSPDLTWPNFFLWDYIKNVFFAQRPTTREDLMKMIRRACAAITRETLLKTVDGFERRLHLCLQANGEHIEQLLRGWL